MKFFHKYNLIFVIMFSVLFFIFEFDVRTYAADITITSQPEDAVVSEGDKVTFKIGAAGENLKYQWQKKVAGSNMWGSSTAASAVTPALTINTKITLDDYSFRCLVTDSKGNYVMSSEVKLYVKEKLSITKQPQNFTAELGKRATFTVEASGYNLSYQWQKKTPDGTKWSNSSSSSANNAVFHITAAEAINGYSFRCIVTDGFMKKTISNAATLVVYPQFYVENQPSDAIILEGNKASFTVKAVGNGLSYQWQKKVAGSNVWSNSSSGSATTSCLSIITKASLSGYSFRCVIRDSTGRSIRSNVVTLDVVQHISVNANAGTVSRYYTSSLITASDVMSGKKNGSIVLSETGFAGGVSHSYKNELVSASYKINYSSDAVNLRVLQFTAYTKSRNTEFYVYCGVGKIKLNTGTTPVTFFIPITDVSTVSNIIISTSRAGAEVLVIDGLYLTDYKTNYSMDKVMTGTITDDGHANVDISAKAVTEEECYSCVVKGDYMFSTANGSVYSYKLSNGAAKLLCSIDGFGVTREVAFSKDKKAIFVTSRQNGLYVVDISNPASMKVISHYDTLEAAVGIAVRGDYVFVSTRYFGVDIIDASDLTSLKHISSAVGDSEYQDCFVDGRYLYVGVYYGKRVDIYDVAVLSSPVLVSTVSLDGSGQGLYVKDGILYVSTGLNSSNSYTNYRYGAGTGNGLEIFDVTNPYTPVRLSVTKIDGRMSCSSYDVWDVTVTDGYAYVSNMFNGIFVYELTDLTNPKCVRRYYSEFASGDSKYMDVYNSKYVYSWNTDEKLMGCFYHVWLESGKLYAASANGGVYIIEDGNAKPEKEIAVYSFDKGATSFELSVDGYDISTYKTDTCIWAVGKYNGYYFAAAGEGGILVLDSNFKCVGKKTTSASVRDLKISGDIIYTAESEGGVAAYRIDGKKLIKLSSVDFEDANSYASQLVTTYDGKYLIVQISQLSHAVIDATDPSGLLILYQKITGTGPVYYRNVVPNVLNGRYNGVYGRDGIIWYTSDNGVFSRVTATENQFYTEGGGMTAYGDLIIAIKRGIYYCFDMNLTNVFSMDFSNINSKGKLYADNNILTVSDEPVGKFSIIDIKDVRNPSLITEFFVEGNPDIPIIDKNEIVIPCRYGGLVRLTKKQ